MSDADREADSATNIGGMLVSSRSFDEYRSMFRLTDDDLAGKILDCPGGAAGFTAAVNGRGGDVTACDSAYSAGVDELVSTVASEVDRGNRYIRTNAEQYDWAFFVDPDRHRHIRRDAARAFAADIRRYPDRYVPARLPSLPFPDAAFDLVLSSHLLFSYSDRFDEAFHLDSICELMRVARGELRIFPLVASGESVVYPRLDELLSDLRGRGIVGELVEVDYRFQKGAHHMLVCRHLGAKDPN